MRFIPTFCLQEGMLLDKSIYNKNGELLFKKGLRFKQQNIENIIQLGIQGVYIDDHISKDIEIENIIDESLRIKAVQKIKDIFVDIENDANNIQENIGKMHVFIEDIVDELVTNKDVIVNMTDIKLFDDYTFFHCVNVAVLSIVMGISLGLKKEDLRDLGMGALLHDVGKVFINKDCLNKREKLTDNEFEQMKQHPMDGYKYIKTRFNLPEQVAMIVLEHHERYDGTGYPNQKAGTDISLFGRIVAIADVYDAITSDRPYRRKLLPSRAIEYILGGSGYHFDFELISIFVRKVAAYPLGTCVRLSNGMTGIVVENFPNACTRPKIKLMGETGEDMCYINLKEDFRNNNLTIIEIIDI